MEMAMRGVKGINLILVICFFLSAAAVGRDGKPIILRGLVVDSNSQPIAGAEVAVFEKCRHYSRWPEYAKMLTSVERTDSEGKFLLKVKPTSQYFTFVVVRKKGFALGWDALTYNRSYKPEYNLYIILEKPHTLAGKVLDGEGAPAAGTTVQAVPKTSYLYRLHQRPIYAPQAWFTVKTGSDGAFAFKNLTADTSADFWVQVQGCDLIYHYTPHRMNGIGFEVGREDLKLVLPRVTTIQGRVVEKKSGAGVPGIGLLLEVRDTKNEQQQRYRNHELVSGADGEFSIRGVPEGKHILRMVTPTDRTAEWIAQTVPINITGERELKKVRVKVEKGTMLEVIARDETTGRPLSGIQMYVRKMSADNSKGFFRIADTGTDGIAHIHVPPGQLNVNVSRCNGYKPPSREGVQVTAFRNKRSRVEIMLEPRFWVRGTVLEVSGRPARPAVVKAYPFGDTVFTDSSGRFEAKTDIKYPVAIVGARDVGRNLAGFTDVMNRPGAVRVQLKPAVSIAGVITDANGAGIPAARVRLFIYNKHGVPFISGVDEVIADSKGRYKIDAVVPEREEFKYNLSVNAAGYGPVEYKRISVKAAAGEVVEMPMMKLVAADASISGIVVDKSGTPAANIPLSVSGYQGFDQPRRRAATDSQGRFLINRICKGPLRIQANYSSSPGGIGFLFAQGGDQDVKVVLGEERTHTAGTSLIGKHLPDLTEFEIEPQIEQKDGTRLLVCFFHINQQPSRHCVEQLNRRAKELQKKGVSVVCVQASHPPRKRLNDWSKKNRISLPIGMVGNDSFKTKREWAVQSLPWLILADREHIVTAEGFGLEELEKKIKEACDVGR